MLNYKLIGNNNFFNPIETIFTNRGIEDFETFLNLEENVELDPLLLDNIKLASDLLIHHLSSKSKIMIQIDEDTDGYTSSAIMYNYLINIGVDSSLIKWRVHGEKAHGINVESIPSDTDLLIVPDASSKEYEKHKQLKEKGIDIIILDHHEAEEYSKSAIVVNNQLSKNYPNKSLSAAGVVYKFIKHLDNEMGFEESDKDINLVAVGIVADVMSTKEKETRYFIQKGIKSGVSNPLIAEIIKLNSTYVDINKLTMKDISWTLAPRINAVTRVGTTEERENMFRSLTYQDLHGFLTVKEFAKEMESIRDRQNEFKEKGIKIVQEIIDRNKLYENSLILVNTKDKLFPSLSGLIASEFSKKYRKPILILRENKDGVLTGSARGYSEGSVEDLKLFLTNINLFNYCEGHSNAHGVSIDRDKVKDVIEITNKKLMNSNEDLSNYKVDFVLQLKMLNYGLVTLIDSFKHAWGKDVEEPKFAIEDIEVEVKNIQIFGAKSNVIKLTSGSTEFIKFNCTPEEIMKIREIPHKKNVRLVVVGTPAINNFRGKVIAQVIMDNFHIKEVFSKEYAF